MDTVKDPNAPIHINVAQYHGTTAALQYHFSIVPVPSALRYYLVPQYHNYRVSSAWYFPMLTHSNEHLLDCIVFVSNCNLWLDVWAKKTHAVTLTTTISCNDTHLIPLLVLNIIIMRHNIVSLKLKYNHGVGSPHYKL